MISRRRIVGKVVGVGIVLAGTLGRGSPGRPREVRRESRQLLGVADVSACQPRGGIVSRKVARPFSLLDRVGGDFPWREDQRVALGVIAILLQRALGEFGGFRGRAHLQCRERPAEALTGNGVAHDLGQAMQVFRAVVRAEIGAVAPQGAVFHERVLEEDLLSGLDVVAGEDSRVQLVGDPSRNGRRVAIGLDGHERQHGEPDDHHQDHAVAPPSRQGGTLGRWVRHGWLLKGRAVGLNLDAHRPPGVP